MTGTWVMHRLCIPVSFPAGVSVGADRDGNAASIARDGAGRAIVRGSSWAGVLRRELRKASHNEALDTWFCADRGFARNVGLPASRHIVIQDSVLRNANNDPVRSVVRTHNAVDRHVGAPVDGALFTVEGAAPGARCTFEVWIKAGSDEDDAVAQLVNALVGAFRRGILVGGSKARGIGEAQLQDGKSHTWRRFDLGSPECLGAWFDIRSGRENNGGKSMDCAVGSGGHTDGKDLGKDLDVTVEFVIPPGQDVLCGDGQRDRLALDVQRVIDADGEAWFRLPGSSLRGVVRGWCARLAARERKPVAYTYERALEKRWTGAEAADVKHDQCVVTALFGSGKGAGRIHIGDAMVSAKKASHSERTHVSIDRAWATSLEGMLFSNGVLDGSEDPFEVRIRIARVQEHEATWIAQTLVAIHIGLIRIGSSKASGRMLVQKCEASGEYAGLVNELMAQNGALACPII